MEYMTLHDLFFFELVIAGLVIIRDPKPTSSRDSSHDQTEKRVTSSVEKHPIHQFCDILLPWGFLAVPMALAGCLWIATVICYFTWLAVAGHDLTFEGHFNPKLHIPLFCGASGQYLWRVAAGVAHYKPAKRLDHMVFRSKVAWPAQWALCVLWVSIIGQVAPALIWHVFDRDACHILPVLCPLHAAYAESLTAKISFWTLVAALGCGLMALMISMMWMKASIGAVIIVLVYQAGIREPLFRYVLQPAMQYGVPPLWVSVLRPISVFVITRMSTPTRRYIASPLAKKFPGPDTKTKYFFPDPSIQFVVGTLVTSPLFILATLTIIGTISEADAHLAPCRDSMNLPLYLAAIYSMMVWLLWRVASALNFAPAVHLDRLVYTSRIGWMLQFCVCFPWLYTLWKMLYFYLFVFLLEQESGFGRALVIISTAGALDLGIFRVNIIGSILGFVVWMIFGAGLVHTVSFIAFALIVCYQKVAGYGESEKHTHAPSQNPSLPDKNGVEKV